MISVIVPVYNSEKYLHRCIDSILAQTFTDFELLLIDDGSTDLSGAICDEYARKDSRVRVFHKKNGGVSSARNMGLDNAQGEWITFVDSDDAIINLTSTTYNEDLIIFPHKVLSKNGVESLYKLDNSVFENKSKVKTFVKENSITGTFKTSCSKLYKRNLIGNLRFDESIKIGEDQVFLLCYLNYVKTCRIVNSYMYLYHGGFQASKYRIPIRNAIYIMEKLVTLSETIDVCDVKFRRDVFFTYKSFCQNDIDKDSRLWYNNPFIIKQWNMIKKECSLLCRIKYSLLSFHLIHSIRTSFKMNVYG